MAFTFGSTLGSSFGPRLCVALAYPLGERMLGAKIFDRAEKTASQEFVANGLAGKNFQVDKEDLC